MNSKQLIKSIEARILTFNVKFKELPNVRYSFGKWTLEQCDLAREIDFINESFGVDAMNLNTLFFTDEKIIAAKEKLLEEISGVQRSLGMKYRELRWTRTYLVVSSSHGHLHKTTDCGTCNKGENATDFAIFSQGSAMEEEELVEMVGECRLHT